MTTPAGAVAADASAQQRSVSRGTSRRSGDSFFTQKIGPLPAWGWMAIAGGGALVFFWWRSREKKQSSSATTAVTYTSGSAGWQNAVSALQAEISALQGSSATTGGGSGSGTGGTTSKTSSKTTSGSTKPTTPYPAPSNLHSTTYATQADLAWNGTAGASQHVQVLLNGKNVQDTAVTAGTSGAGHYSATGLKKSTTYQWRVAQQESSSHLASAWVNSTFRTKA